MVPKGLGTDKGVNTAGAQRRGPVGVMLLLDVSQTVQLRATEPGTAGLRTHPFGRPHHSRIWQREAHRLFRNTVGCLPIQKQIGILQLTVVGLPFNVRPQPLTSPRGESLTCCGGRPLGSHPSRGTGGSAGPAPLAKRLPLWRLRPSPSGLGRSPSRGGLYSSPLLQSHPRGTACSSGWCRGRRSRSRMSRSRGDRSSWVGHLLEAQPSHDIKGPCPAVYTCCGYGGPIPHPYLLDLGNRVLLWLL